MNPKRLFNIFLTVSVLGFFIILSVSYWGMSHSLMQYNIENAKRNSISIGYALFQTEKSVLLNKDETSLRESIPKDMFDDFDQRMRILLKPLNIVEIDIFNPQTTILYSTDDEDIGKQEAQDQKLLNALQGKVQPSIQFKDVFSDLDNQTHHNIEVVETYLPMYDSNKKIVGAYEVYINITPDKEKFSSTLFSQIKILTALVLIIFVSLGFIMLRGTKQINIYQNALKHESIHDVLTGIYNRRHLNVCLGQELAKIKRAGKSNKNYQVGVIIIDIDHFKKFNDSFGHLVGDKILIAFAKRLNCIIRDNDILGRFGGEEFLIILPLNNQEETLLFAQRTLQEITKSCFNIDGHEHKVTASFGLSQLHVADSSSNNVLSRADKALYSVKQNGRNGIAENNDDA